MIEGVVTYLYNTSETTRAAEKIRRALLLLQQRKCQCPRDIQLCKAFRMIKDLKSDNPCFTRPLGSYLDEDPIEFDGSNRDSVMNKTEVGETTELSANLQAFKRQMCQS